MARTKSLIAILLALALLVSPTTSLLADGPGSQPNGPIEGHPWDDEASAQSDPSSGVNRPNTPGKAPVLGGLPVVNVPTFAPWGSRAQMVAQLMRSIVGSWLKISETRVIKSKVARHYR